jgi:TRAP-type C4-dicarboxylate transport system permease small subunit
MVVAAAGKPRLLGFIVGLMCIFFSATLVLYVYSYALDTTRNGYTILDSSQVLPLFVFIGGVLLLSLYGGYEVGRFIEVSNQDRSKRRKQ